MWWRSYGQCVSFMVWRYGSELSTASVSWGVDSDIPDHSREWMFWKPWRSERFMRSEITFKTDNFGQQFATIRRNTAWNSTCPGNERWSLESSLKRACRRFGIEEKIWRVIADMSLVPVIDEEGGFCQPNVHWSPSSNVKEVRRKLGSEESIFWENTIVWPLCVREEDVSFAASCKPGIVHLCKTTSVISCRSSAFPFIDQVQNLPKVKIYRSLSSIGKASERVWRQTDAIARRSRTLQVNSSPKQMR